jgi:crotonobetainyl-CoA:carnitine CoA-transferase CaiB-like acyl-CoA transferase
MNWDAVPMTSGVLSGIRIVEVAGIGPGPFCGMLLADLGAEVVLVERQEQDVDPLVDLGRAAIVHRGKRSIELDLKNSASIEILLRLLETADGLIEGLRPGVMERLGLGPDICLARNPRLAYGRITGWGQEGPLSQSAGHDLNYVGLSGALWYAGQPGEPPVTPPTLIGDVGGGALYLAIGLLAAILHVRHGGTGQVIDAAIVDGSAHLTSILLSLRAAGRMPTERGKGVLDGSHWSNSYRCADGRDICVQPFEPRFYRILLEKIGLEGDPDFNEQLNPTRWPEQRRKLAAHFASRPRAEWLALLDGSDACYAPVLSPEEASRHPHLAARGTYLEIDKLLQAAPAPRFSRGNVAPGPVPERGADTASILASL